MNMLTFFGLGSFALGLIGTILGVVNFARDILSSRVRLRVSCYPLAILQPGNTIKECACVEVVNLGSFPITLKDIVFEPLSERHNRMTMANNGCLNGKHLPVRIEPHDSEQICYFNHEAAATMIKQCRRVVVETACGKLFFSELKKYHDILERCAQNATEAEQAVG